MGSCAVQTAASEGITLAHRTRGGRIRLRVPRLPDHGRSMARLGAALDADPRVEEVRARAATGSVILRAPALTSDAAVLSLAREALGRALSPDAPARSRGAPRPERAARDWHAEPAEDVLASLGTDPDRGLGDTQAERRRARHGPNVLPQDERQSQLALFAQQFNSLPVAMLTVSSVFSIATGGVADAVATLSVVGVNAVFGFVTEGQAEAAIHKLMDTSQEEVSAIRDGRRLRIGAAHLVPGDIVEVRAGTQLAADMRLLAAENLRVDESALTGETLPVSKDPAARVEADAPVGARATLLHGGTLVAEGSGRAVVVETGAHTAAARISLLSSGAQRPRAPVEEELERLSGTLAKLSLLACGAFFGIGWARGMALSAILKDALALAVAAVPEGLPVVATTTMSLGLRRMERKGILVRQMDAVETLGALQVICLDKTGTLTRNRLAVCEGAAGLRRTEELADPALATLAEVAALNNDAEPGADGARGSSGTERALLDFAAAHGVDAAALRAASPRDGVVERTLSRPWMATTHGDGTGCFLVKGSPDAVLAMCDSYLEDGEHRALDEETRARVRQLNDEIAARPARVLGFARGPVPDDPESPAGLTWLGLLGMSDPVREGAKDFIAAMHGAGLRTIMITGDQVATAEAIARELDLAAGEALRIVDAPRLGDLSPEVLAGIARRTHVFSRVSAQHKLAIVKALQSSGQVVAMTGDGVNDGPALKAADIGIAMGATGTDLAREVANVVIRDDELRTLEDAIAQGRSVYRNIRRALEFLITTNMSEIAVGLVEAAHGPNELETPMELLWINLVSDVLPGLGLALADPDPDVMRRPPRAPGEPIIPEHDFRRMGLDGGTIAASALVSHFVGLARYGPGPKTRGMTFLSLSLGQLLYTMMCQRSDVRELRPDKLLENRALDGAVLVSSGLAVLPFFVPPLRRLLGVAPIGLSDSAIALTGAVAPAAAVLARRGVRIDLDTVEGRPCGTS